jgi:hypothetical protein
MGELLGQRVLREEAVERRVVVPQSHETDPTEHWRLAVLAEGSGNADVRVAQALDRAGSRRFAQNPESGTNTDVSEMDGRDHRWSCCRRSTAPAQSVGVDGTA